MSTSIDDLHKKITQDYGDVLVPLSDYIEDAPSQVSWSPSLDMLLTGGIDEGSWVGVTGPKKVGKTMCLLSLAAQAQKAGMRVYYDKAEGRLSGKHASEIEGLDSSPDKFMLIESNEDKILSQLDHLQILQRVLMGTTRSFVIIDCISSYVQDKVLAEGLGTETRGGAAKLFTQFLDMMCQVVPAKKHIVCGITRRIANTSGYGPPDQEKAAKGWGHQCDYQLHFKSGKPWMAGEKQIGLEIDAHCLTSKNGPPGLKTTVYFRFGHGVDRLFEIINTASSIGVIQKKHNWFYLSFLGDDPPKANGAEKLYQLFLQNPEWTDKLYQTVMSLAGVTHEGGGAKRAGVQPEAAAPEAG